MKSSITNDPGAPFPFVLIGPRGDPDGLLPYGVPGSVYPFPFGTIANGKASE